MAIRHYVLLATDGFIDLPNTGELCTTDTTSVYIFGFVGGLYQVIENGKVQYINTDLQWDSPDPVIRENLFKLKGTATIPSPIIWGEVGDHIYITLINLGMLKLPLLTDFHTVHIHGGHVATQLDGFPESSFGVPMWMDPMTIPPTATYFFQPENPGTLMYHCHVEASEHVQMGMYGALVIYPSIESLAAAGIKKCKGKWLCHGEPQPQIPGTATNRSFAYNNINTYFDKEYVMLLSDIDNVWHEAVLTSNLEFNAVDFKPNYWLVNGRAFPDTLLPHPQTPQPGSDPNLSQINYESYVHINTGEKFLQRMINMGYQVVPWHIHGWHFTVIGKDSHLSPFLKIAAQLKKLDKKHSMMHNHLDHETQEMGFTATIGSGETYDLLLTADDKRPLYRQYIVEGQDEIPSLCSQMAELQSLNLDPSPIFDIPTEPVSCPPDTKTVNYVKICNNQQGFDRFFPQFYPAHNHDDYKVTNDGAYPGGQLIFIQTDEPKHCEPKPPCEPEPHCEPKEPPCNGVIVNIRTWS